VTEEAWSSRRAEGWRGKLPDHEAGVLKAVRVCLLHGDKRRPLLGSACKHARGCCSPGPSEQVVSRKGASAIIARGLFFY